MMSLRCCRCSSAYPFQLNVCCTAHSRAVSSFPQNSINHQREPQVRSILSFNSIITTTPMPNFTSMPIQSRRCFAPPNHVNHIPNSNTYAVHHICHSILFYSILSSTANHNKFSSQFINCCTAPQSSSPLFRTTKPC